MEVGLFWMTNACLRCLIRDWRRLLGRRRDGFRQGLVRAGRDSRAQAHENLVVDGYLVESRKGFKVVLREVPLYPGDDLAASSADPPMGEKVAHGHGRSVLAAALDPLQEFVGTLRDRGDATPPRRSAAGGTPARYRSRSNGPTPRCPLPLASSAWRGRSRPSFEPVLRTSRLQVSQRWPPQTRASQGWIGTAPPSTLSRPSPSAQEVSGP